MDNEPVYCDVCGKDMKDRKSKTTMIGVQLSIQGRDGIVSKEYLKTQLGEFSLGRQYKACFECWLKSVGFKP